MSSFNRPGWLFNFLIFASLWGCSTSGWASGDTCLVQELRSGLGAAEVRSTLPPIISKHELVPLAHKVTDLSRLKEATQVLNIHNSHDKTRLSGLSDGTYVYVIDTSGNLLIANRVMDPGVAAMQDPGATFLASHAGLATLLESELKAPPQFVAAGEVVIRSGLVKVISNGSGTFRGGTPNLTYAAEQMHSLGLAVDAKTELRDYSANSYADPHGAVEAQVRQALELAHDPHLKKIWDYTRKVMSEMERTFKDSQEIRAIIFDPSTPPADKSLLFQGIQFISSWRQLQDEEGYIVHHSLKKMGEEKYLTMLKKFSELVSAKSK